MRMIILLVAMILAGCSSDIDKVKSGVLPIDRTTTIGKAVDGCSAFSGVVWSGGQDQQGRNFVQFIATINSNIVSNAQKEFFEHQLNQFKQKIISKENGIQDDINIAGKDNANCKDALARNIKIYENTKSALSEIINGGTKKEIDSRVQSITIQIITARDSIVAKEQSINNRKRYMATIQDQPAALAQQSEWLNNELKEVEPIQRKIESYITAYQDTLTEIEHSIQAHIEKCSSMEYAIKQIKESFEAVKQEDADLIKNFKLQVTPAKAEYMQQFLFSADGKSFIPAYSALIVYDDSGKKLSENKADKLDNIYRNDLSIHTFELGIK